MVIEELTKRFLEVLQKYGDMESPFEATQYMTVSDLKPTWDEIKTAFENAKKELGK